MKKRKMRQWLAMLCMAAAVTMLAGCSFGGFSAESLMRPPAASGDGAGLQQALSENLGDQITLRYPRSGEHRSAVVQANIDGDAAQEAIVFYRPATENSGARMAVLDMDEDNKWQLVSAGESTVGEIDRVMFGDLDGDGAPDIVTGWSIYSGTSKLMMAHSYIGGELRSIPVMSDVQTEHDTQHAENMVITASADIYTEMALADFDKDGRDEIMSVHLNTVDGNSTARFIELRRDSYSNTSGLYIAHTAPLDGRMVKYIGVQAAQVSYENYAMVLDGYRADGVYTTEVVRWDAKKQCLEAPFNDSGTNICTFVRSQNMVSQDFNADGIMNFPTDSLVAGYTAADEAPLYLTTWHRFYGDSVQDEKTVLMCTDNGYYIQFSSKWQSEVSVRPEQQSDQPLDIMYFYRETDSGFTSEIMRIKVFTPDEWEQEDAWEPLDILADDEEAPRYMELISTDYYVYGVLISTDMGLDKGELTTTYEEVLEAFRLLP